VGGGRHAFGRDLPFATYVTDDNDMHRQPAQSPPKTMLEEYAAELAPALGELASTLGSTPRRPGAADARNAGEEAPTAARNLEMVMRIPVTVKIVLGSATMPVANLMRLGRGAVIPLDRRVGEPVDVVVNGRVVARGEVVVVDESTSRFGIKLTDVVGPSDTDKPA
jgi:flagellar motor switch protein FliN/FliY